VTLAATAVRACSGAGESAVADTAGRLMGFLDYFAGVFCLLSLTGAVVCGLAATDRRVLSPRGRVAMQSVHRAMSVGAVGFLGAHIAVKIAERESGPLVPLLPFSGGATFAVGLGTLAADLMVLAAVTGVLRGRFADSGRPWLWRPLHSAAYLCWPVALAHGLTAGRPAAVWVLWSYGTCAALIGLALLVRVLAAGGSGGARRAAQRSLLARRAPRVTARRAATLSAAAASAATAYPVSAASRPEALTATASAADREWDMSALIDPSPAASAAAAGPGPGPYGSQQPAFAGPVSGPAPAPAPGAAPWGPQGAPSGWTPGPRGPQPAFAGPATPPAPASTPAHAPWGPEAAPGGPVPGPRRPQPHVPRPAAPQPFTAADPHGSTPSGAARTGRHAVPAPAVTPGPFATFDYSAYAEPAPQPQPQAYDEWAEADTGAWRRLTEGTDFAGTPPWGVPTVPGPGNPHHPGPPGHPGPVEGRR